MFTPLFLLSGHILYYATKSNHFSLSQILFLPEAADYIGTSSSESLKLAKPISSSPFVLGLRDAAKQHNLAIHVGVHDLAPHNDTASNNNDPSGKDQSNTNTESQQQQKLYNTTIYLPPSGLSPSPATTYNKLHLFDYGTMRESASTQSGSHFTPPFPSPVGLLGSLICFDLRFPEAALHLAKPLASQPPSPDAPEPAVQAVEKGQAAEVILYPAAFTVDTGLVHWEVLLRARAIETQSWVVAAAQVGRHHPYEQGGKRVSYGHSMVVDPWGRVVVELKGVEDVHNGNGDSSVENSSMSSRSAGKGKQDKKEERWEAVDGAVGELGIFEVDLDYVTKVRGEMPLVRRT